MNKCARLAVIGALSLTINSMASMVAKAQVRTWGEPGVSPIDGSYQPSMDPNLYGALFRSAAALDALRNALHQAGLAKIRQGKATTLFTPVAASLAPQYYAERNGKTPAERQTLAQNYATLLQAFRQQAAAHKIPPNDLAEAFSLAFVLNYKVYSSGEGANEAQRALITRDFRKSLLADTLFQGDTERNKQLLYEQKAIDTVAAVCAYEEGVREKDSAKQERARAGARALLAGWWNQPIDGLELTPAGFADRGLRLIREGKATTKFALASEAIMPGEAARDEKRDWDRFGHIFARLSEEEWRRQYIAERENRYNSYLAEFHKYEKERGLASNDLADGQALCVLINYYVYSGGTELNAQQLAWVLKEMQHDVLSFNTWQDLSDRDKQRSYGALAIDAIDALVRYRAAVEKRRSAQQAGDGMVRVTGESLAKSMMDIARSRAHKSLVSLFSPRPFDQYALTDTGFAQTTQKK